MRSRFEVKWMVLYFFAFLLVSSIACHAKEMSQKRDNGGFKVVIDDNGKYWFESPKGERFLSMGITHVYAKPDDRDITPGTDYYHAVENQFGGNFYKWKDDVVGIMSRGGFNTYGAWSNSRLISDGGMYGTICLYVAGYNWERCMDGFLPDFESTVRRNVRGMLRRYVNIDNVFGVYLDNEMHWYGESPWTIVSNYTLLEFALFSKENPNYTGAVSYYDIVRDFLIGKYETAKAFGDAWGRPLKSWDDLNFAYAQSCMNNTAMADRDEFIALAAEKFYSRSTKVVREMLPGKLILGTRYAQRAPEGVVRACGKYCDVISFNDYRNKPVPDDHLLAQYFIWGSRKPILIGEYAWRSEENSSGCPNSTGAGTIVKTQAERAANYSEYTESLLSYPMVVGAHWFEYADQSPQGRANGGEDSNYGVVDIKNRPYTELLNAMAETNKKVAKLHAESKVEAFASLPDPEAVIFEPGQRPERPAFIDLLAEEPIRPADTYNAGDGSAYFDKSKIPYIFGYDTGKEWGCGFSVFGPKKYAVGKGSDIATDLDGYTELIIDAKIRKGLLFDVYFNEAGVGPAYNESFNTSAGDDGESFMFKNVEGKGGRSTYVFELKDLKPRTDYGNQRGKRRVDMNAATGIAFLLKGHQGSGQIEIYSLRLSR